MLPHVSLLYGRPVAHQRCLLHDFDLVVRLFEVHDSCYICFDETSNLAHHFKHGFQQQIKTHSFVRESYPSASATAETRTAVRVCVAALPLVFWLISLDLTKDHR